MIWQTLFSAKKKKKKKVDNLHEITFLQKEKNNNKEL